MALLQFTRFTTTVVAIFLILSSASASVSDTPGPVVKTKYGPLQGVSVPQGSVFLGIPFAAPPVGDLRWQPPLPPAAWAPGTFNATAFSAACIPHTGTIDPFPHGTRTPALGNGTSEDCLYLNVFTPAIAKPGGKLPVIFWIHGGNFFQGSAMDFLYDGRFLANKTIVVAANYRLSALGFLVAGQGEGAATGNYGILDQIAALQWVQDNIAEFGGDRDRVTIFGQSAGAYSVLLHMTCKKSDHLFHRAIASSPPPTLYFRTALEARVLGDDFSRLLNCTAGDMDCMRSASASQVAQAQNAAGTKVVNPFRLIELLEPWGPTIDGDLVRGQVMDLLSNGEYQQKPVIIGSTTEEAILLVYDGTAKPLSTLEYEAIVYGLFLTNAPAVLRRYPPSHSGDERPVASLLLTHYLFSCPIRHVQRRVAENGTADIWSYVFAHPLIKRGGWSRNYTFCEGHVCHGTDLFFTFRALRLRGYYLTHDEKKLADSMAYYYGNLAHSGDPNRPATHPYKDVTGDVLRWPPFSASDNFTGVRFDDPLNSLERGYLEETCGFWDRINPYP
ncbi:cAMP-regulated D2 protein-like [Branchiostoma floridae]|uniref:Carboxylic ester hydrolase n=1 Tax=Branchiostoma floridae TaxID=7739 RepID=A0A9J7LJE7_BRAFL|nr:cAMP-regulated D2 protein-like [Branchiostoma floridae]